MSEQRLRLALAGYGKMGREIVNMAPNFNIEISGIIYASLPEHKAIELLKTSDVAMVFTSPQGAFLQVSRALYAGIPVMCGTTAWEKQIPEAKKLCKELNGTMLIANNCSLGVNLFFALNDYLCKLMQKFTSYKVSIEEIHHSSKQDKPSGTALELASRIMQIRPDLQDWVLAEKSSSDNKIPINSLREGKVVGQHMVNYSSDIDSISINHKAKTRAGFVSGALIAARFIASRKGIFCMQDVLKQELNL